MTPDNLNDYSRVKKPYYFQILDDSREVVSEALNGLDGRNVSDWSYIKTVIKDTLRDFLWKKTKRSPMILPIITEINL